MGATLGANQYATVRHLVPTPEAFAEQIARDFGPEARLHPANRITACGRRMGNLSVTTDPSRSTCKVCAKHTTEEA